MLVVMQEGASEAQTESVIGRLVTMGFTVHRSTGVRHTLLGGVGPQDDFDPAEHKNMVCVESGNVKQNKILLAPGKSSALKVIISSRPA